MFLGLLLIVLMAIWNFPLVAGSDALALSLLSVLLLVALVDGIAHGAHLRSKNPEVFAGLSQDLEKVEEQQDRAELQSWSAALDPDALIGWIPEACVPCPSSLPR